MLFLSACLLCRIIHSESVCFLVCQITLSLSISLSLSLSLSHTPHTIIVIGISYIHGAELSGNRLSKKRLLLSSLLRLQGVVSGFFKSPETPLKKSLKNSVFVYTVPCNNNSHKVMIPQLLHPKGETPSKREWTTRVRLWLMHFGIFCNCYCHDSKFVCVYLLVLKHTVIDNVLIVILLSVTSCATCCTEFMLRIMTVIRTTTKTKQKML